MLVSYDPFYPTPDGVKTALDIDMCQGLDDAMVDTHLTTKKTEMRPSVLPLFITPNFKFLFQMY